MRLTPKIQKAIIKATLLHDCQIRKGDDLPYVVHPFSVAYILSCYTDDENVIIAGLLHDVIEEVKGYGFESIKKDFGKKSAEIVQEATEDKELKKKGNRETWKRRKDHYIENLKVCSQEALMVSAADKIHNLLSIIEAYKIQGEKLWKRFNADKKDSLWFYTEVLKMIKKRLQNEIIQEFEKTHKEARKIFIK